MLFMGSNCWYKLGVYLVASGVVLVRAHVGSVLANRGLVMFRLSPGLGKCTGVQHPEAGRAVFTGGTQCLCSLTWYLLGCSLLDCMPTGVSQGPTGHTPSTSRTTSCITQLALEELLAYSWGSTLAHTVPEQFWVLELLLCAVVQQQDRVVSQVQRLPEALRSM